MVLVPKNICTIQNTFQGHCSLISIFFDKIKIHQDKFFASGYLQKESAKSDSRIIDFLLWKRKIPIGYLRKIPIGYISTKS